MASLAMARASAGVSCWAAAGAEVMTRAPSATTTIARRSSRAPGRPTGAVFGFAVLDTLDLPHRRSPARIPRTRAASPKARALRSATPRLHARVLQANENFQISSSIGWRILGGPASSLNQKSALHFLDDRTDVSR